MKRRFGWFSRALLVSAIAVAGSAEAREFERGDVNTDGFVNIADPVSTLDHLFNGGVAYCRDAMDSNDDGAVDIADPILNFMYLFNGGAPPEAPFGTCGEDPTADSLECHSHDPCNLGDAIPGLTPEEFASFLHGKELMDKAFTPAEGLGPRFNTQSCTACHNTPLTGGSAPLYRNFFLTALGPPGAQTGVPGLPSLVMPSYTNVGEERVRMPTAAQFPGVPITLAHRNAPSILGTGLFEFVGNAAILANADPNDSNSDGISGRFNTDGFGNIGRFGYKLQANFIEAFIRGAANNQMGMTTNPVQGSAGVVSYNWQVGAGFDQRTTDFDGVPDPEISVADFGDIINFNRFVAPPKPKAFGPEENQGAILFSQIGCVSCHVPSLPSAFGPIYPYTDLLLHDLGPALADGISMGMPQFSTIDPLNTANEFRTQPLWGVSMHGPWLHDGRAGSIHEAITLHGGEAESIRDAYVGLTPVEQAAVLAFLEAL